MISNSRMAHDGYIPDGPKPRRLPRKPILKIDHRRKLSIQDVRYIASSHDSALHLAIQYGVGTANVHRIRRNAILELLKEQG